MVRRPPWVHPITPVDLLAYYEDLALVDSGRMLARPSPPPSRPARRRWTTAGRVPRRPRRPATASTPGRQWPSRRGPRPPPTAAAPALPHALGGRPGARRSATAATGWAIGRGAAVSGGMLVAEPDLPWEGELRLWESHLSVPGRPRRLRRVAHRRARGAGRVQRRASAFAQAAAGGQRGTAYQLELEPGDPTRYRVDGQTMAMTSHRFSVEVARGDGTTGIVERTLWTHRPGAGLSTCPGMGWTDATAVAYRDANADNTAGWTWCCGSTGPTGSTRCGRPTPSWAVCRGRHRGGHGRRAGLVRQRRTDAERGPRRAGRRAARSGTPTPGPRRGARRGWSCWTGPTSSTHWNDAPGAPAPGLVPFADAPQLERDDWVVASGDGHWLVNPEQPITGRPPLFGPGGGGAEPSRAPVPGPGRGAHRHHVAERPLGRRATSRRRRWTPNRPPAGCCATRWWPAAGAADDVVAVPAGPPSAAGTPLWDAQEVHLEPGVRGAGRLGRDLRAGRPGGGPVARAAGAPRWDAHRGRRALAGAVP